MARMHHPFVMSIVNSQQDEACLYMMMELMQGGELGSIMSSKTRKYLTEDNARFYAAGVLEGLSYMHRRHYVYRDLKGENVLLDNDGYAVIVDLGFGMFVMMDAQCWLLPDSLILCPPLCIHSQVCPRQDVYVLRNSAIHSARGDS